MITIGLITAFIAGLVSGLLIRYWKQILIVLLAILAVAAFAVLKLAKRGISVIGENGTEHREGTHRLTDEEIDELVNAEVITYEEGERMKEGGTVYTKVYS